MKNPKMILVLCGFLLISTQAFAHPPSDIKIEFDNQTKTLKAAVLHHVSNPDTHFIRKVDIAINGVEIKTMTYTKQISKAGQTFSIVLPEVKSGDLLSVEGYCNLSGKLKKEIKIS